MSAQSLMSFTHVAPRATAAAAHHTEFHELPANDRVLARVTSRPRVELQNLVSHTTQDDASLCASLLAKGISEALITVNVPTFFDATALHGGVVWGRAIEASAAGAQAFVAIITPSYPERYWCMRELGEHDARNEPARGFTDGCACPFLVHKTTPRLPHPDADIACSLGGVTARRIGGRHQDSCLGRCLGHDAPPRCRAGGACVSAAVVR